MGPSTSIGRACPRAGASSRTRSHAIHRPGASGSDSGSTSTHAPPGGRKRKLSIRSPAARGQPSSTGVRGCPCSGSPRSRLGPAGSSTSARSRFPPSGSAADRNSSPLRKCGPQCVNSAVRVGVSACSRSSYAMRLPTLSGATLTKPTRRSSSASGSTPTTRGPSRPPPATGTVRGGGSPPASTVGSRNAPGSTRVSRTSTGPIAKLYISASSRSPGTDATRQPPGVASDTSPTAPAATSSAAGAGSCWKLFAAIRQTSTSSSFRPAARCGARSTASCSSRAATNRPGPYATVSPFSRSRYRWTANSRSTAAAGTAARRKSRRKSKRSESSPAAAPTGRAAFRGVCGSSTPRTYRLGWLRSQ